MSASPEYLVSVGGSNAQSPDAEALAQLRLVTDHAPVLLVYCDRDIRFRFVNKPYADRLGLTPAEIIGRRIPEVIGDGAYATFRHYVEETLSGHRVEFETEIPYETIGPHVMHCTCAPDFAPDGTVRGLVAVLADVTERRRAEQAWRDSEQRFIQFMQHLPGLAWIKDTQGRYVYANDHAIEVFGTSREELYGRTDTEVFPLESARQFQENDQRALESVGGIQVIEALEHPELGVRYSLVSKFPLVGSDGQATLVGGMAVDITEWRRTEEEMRHSEQRFRSLMEQAPFSIQIFRPDGTTLRVNRAWEELWGFTFEELAGYNVLHDSQLEAKGVMEYIRQGFAGTPAQIPIIEYDPTETIPNLEPQEDPRRWLSAVIYPIKDAAGVVREVVLIHQDITARHRAEKELQRARGRLDAALEAGAIATWTYDVVANRLTIDKNIVRMFELPEDEPLDAPLDRFTRTIHPDDWPGVQAALARALEGKGDYEAEYRHVQVTGRVRWVISRGKVEWDETGRPIRMPGVLFEITERKKLEEELRLRVEQLDEVDRRKDEFLATLAHELRNPLAPICNSLQILKMPRVDSETLQQTREMMERQVQHLVRLVDDLLDVSRVMRGKIELRRECVELATIIARAVETAQPTIDVQGHSLEMSVADESLLVEVDPVRIAQVLSNLLTNAAKYTEPGGHLWLTARREGQSALLSLRDDGIGISPEMLPQVFQLFVQVDHSSTKAQGGLGIGLTLAKNLVEMHGGTIEAQSSGLGKGSEFIIRLPLVELPPVEEPKSQTPAAEPSPPRTGHRLLVVDDNRDAAITLSMLLRLRGHEVQMANDGPTAIEAAKQFEPVLVFLDLGMPGMDGFEVARRLRGTPELERTMLVALTGWGQEEDRRRTAEAGFDHHLVKPPEAEAITEILASLAARE